MAVLLCFALLLTVFTDQFATSFHLRPKKLTKSLMPVNKPTYQRKNAVEMDISTRLKGVLKPYPNSECPVNGEIGVASIIGNIIVAYSLYILRSTGCGLPPGYFGLEGALEGISYTGVIAMVGWSVYTKITTSYTLPEGTFNSQYIYIK